MKAIAILVLAQIVDKDSDIKSCRLRKNGSILTYVFIELTETPVKVSLKPFQKAYRVEGTASLSLTALSEIPYTESSGEGHNNLVTLKKQRWGEPAASGSPQSKFAVIIWAAFFKG